MDTNDKNNKPEGENWVWNGAKWIWDGITGKRGTSLVYNPETGGYAAQDKATGEVKEVSPGSFLRDNEQEIGVMSEEAFDEATDKSSTSNRVETEEDTKGNAWDYETLTVEEYKSRDDIPASAIKAAMEADGKSEADIKEKLNQLDTSQETLDKLFSEGTAVLPKETLDQDEDDSKLGGGEGVGTYNAGNNLSVTKEIDDISNELVESTKKVSDDMINDLMANADKVLAGLGEDNYLKEIPMTITAMYDKGLIDKNQKNVMIANQIFTAIGNFSRGYQGKDRVQSQAEKVINSRLENATERYNKAKEAKIKAYTDVIETDKTLNAQQRSKALDVLADPKIQNLMTSFSEAESIRKGELLKRNMGVFQDLTTEQIAMMLQLEMMAGNVEGQDILMNVGADLGIDLLKLINEGDFGPIKGTFFGGN